MSEEWTIEGRGLFSRDFSCIFFSLAADENNIISETPQKHRLVIGIAGMFRRSCLDYKLTNVCFRLSSVLFLSFDHLSEHSCFHVLSLPLTLFCWTPLIILYASHLIKAIGFWVSWTPAVFTLLFPSVSVFLLTRGSVSLFYSGLLRLALLRSDHTSGERRRRRSTKGFYNDGRGELRRSVRSASLGWHLAVMTPAVPTVASH